MKHILLLSLRSLGAIVFFVLLAPLVLHAQSGSWTTASSDGFVGGYGLASAEIGGKIYVTGGSVNGTQSGGFNTLQMYDPSTDVWSTPVTTGTFTPRDRLCAVVVGGKIYTLGGYDFQNELNTFEVFDPQTNAWSTPLTTGTFTASRQAAVVVANGKIYVMGGYDGTNFLNRLEVFDPTTNTWTTPTTTGTFTARSGHCAGVVNGKIYVMGGYDGTNVLNTLEVLDPSTNSWSTPVTTGSFTPRSGPAAVLLDNKIYVFGGRDDKTPINLFNIFDPTTNSWSTPSTTGTLTARNGPSASIVSGKMYVLGGAGNGVYNRNEVFTPSSSAVKNYTPAADILISPNPTSKIATVYNAPENLTNITIMNVLGEKVLELASPHAPNLTLDLSTFPAGIYYSRFAWANSVVLRKIVKE